MAHTENDTPRADGFEKKEAREAPVFEQGGEIRKGNAGLTKMEFIAVCGTVAFWNKKPISDSVPRILRRIVQFGPTAPSSEKLKLVCNGLISQHVDLAVQLQIARGVKLAHEDDDHVFFGINGKFGIEESAPTKLAGRS
jgi:hypothetical protein